MKVILINPPPHQSAEYSRFLERDAIQTYTMPLGLGYIASVLEQAGHEVRLVDAYAKRMSHADIEGVVRDARPDVVGITCMSDQRGSWFGLVSLIRSIDSRIRIVLGGPHPTLMPGQVLLNFRPDAVVLGEGEETMLELVRAWETGSDLDAVKGIAFLKDEGVCITGPRERIRDLDRLPFPAYHLVDLDDYTGWGLLGLLFAVRGIHTLPRYASITTSRGCVGNCQYCSAPFIWQRRWTYRSAENVVDEIEMLIRTYGVEFIIISDDIFSVNQKRVIAICEEILRRKLTVSWGFETSVRFVSRELLDMARKAGCFCILYGVESGSPDVLSNISKNIKEDDVVKAFSMTREAGIVSGAFLMVGNPGESEKDVDETIELIRKARPDVILPQIAMITPGTKFFEIARDRGFIDESYWLTDRPFPYYTHERSLKTLMRWQRKLYYYHHGNLGVLLRTLRDAVELSTGIRISRKGFEKTEIPA